MQIAEILTEIVHIVYVCLYHSQISLALFLLHIFIHIFILFTSVLSIKGASYHFFHA